MSLRRETPCDFGPCPYEAQYGYTCEYYCSEPEPEPDDYCSEYCENDLAAVYQFIIDHEED